MDSYGEGLPAGVTSSEERSSNDHVGLRSISNGSWSFRRKRYNPAHPTITALSETPVRGWESQVYVRYPRTDKKQVRHHPPVQSCGGGQIRGIGSSGFSRRASVNLTFQKRLV